MLLQSKIQLNRLTALMKKYECVIAAKGAGCSILQPIGLRYK